MKILIVDDEPIAREILREHLESIPGAQVVGEAATGAEALEEIQRLRPDLLLLDLQMPGMGGFQVVRNLRAGAPPVVVYVTAYERHALEAFETGAADYLLKPVRRERLQAALDRAQARLAAMSPPTVHVRKVVGRLGEDLHLLEPGEVIAFRADGELVHIITAQGRFLAEHSLRALEGNLPCPPFRRVHRAAIINTDHIKRISPLSSKRWLLRMTNGLEVIVSKRLAGAMREEMRW